MTFLNKTKNRIVGRGFTPLRLAIHPFHPKPDSSRSPIHFRFSSGLPYQKNHDRIGGEQNDPTVTRMKKDIPDISGGEAEGRKTPPYDSVFDQEDGWRESSLRLMRLGSVQGMTPTDSGRDRALRRPWLPLPHLNPIAHKVPHWDILWLFLLTRVLLILVTYFGYILLTQPKYSSAPVDISTLISSWDQWDAKRYLNIALQGYHPAAYDLAFFPLFPVLIIILSYPFGEGSYFIIGMLLSNLALLGALFFLHTLAEELGGEQTGRRTVLYLCIFPTAFFFFTAYNESLFLFFTLGGFLALRRQRWWLAGLAGGLSALTRSTGLFFVFPFLYELWIYQQQTKTLWGKPTGYLLLRAVTALMLVPLGTFLYCLYNWKITGNPMAFAAVQSHWSRSLSLPWTGIWQNSAEIFWIQPFGSFSQVHALIDLTMTLGFIALTILGWRKSPMSYNIWLAFVFMYILITPSTGQADGLISNQRFVLEMFPAFITLALLGQRHPRLHQAILWIFPAFLAIFSLLFVLGKWMV